MPGLRTLDHRFRPLAERFFQWARQVAPGLVVTSARRTFQEQARLYQAYLRGQNDGLPALPPGTSDHEHGLAMDLAHPGIHPLADPSLPELGAEWLRWGGRWSARDPVHFASPAKMTALASRRRPSGRRRRATA